MDNNAQLMRIIGQGLDDGENAITISINVPASTGTPSTTTKTSSATNNPKPKSNPKLKPDLKMPKKKGGESSKATTSTPTPTTKVKDKRKVEEVEATENIAEGTAQKKKKKKKKTRAAPGSVMPWNDAADKFVMLALIRKCRGKKFSFSDEEWKEVSKEMGTPFDSNYKAVQYVS